jgi:hypothetical protein
MSTKRTLTTVLAVVAVSWAAAAAALAAPKPHGILYRFTGHLTAASATSVSVTVDGGNQPALRKLLGQSAQQSFTVGSGTEFLRWSRGIPTVVQVSGLAAGDVVNIHVRAPRGATLAQIEAQAAGIVGDVGPNPQPPSKPLYEFSGKLVAAGSTSVTLNVRGGNRHALRLLVGQSAQQTFTAGPETIFLLWQGKVPTVISAAQLKVGDRITVRIRAAAHSTLAQVEAAPAVHVGDHEPASAAT